MLDLQTRAWKKTTRYLSIILAPAWSPKKQQESILQPNPHCSSLGSTVWVLHKMMPFKYTYNKLYLFFKNFIYYFNHIYPSNSQLQCLPDLPPMFLPHAFLSSIFWPVKSHLCCPYTQGCGPINWGMSNLLRPHTPKNWPSLPCQWIQTFYRSCDYFFSQNCQPCNKASPTNDSGPRIFWLVHFHTRDRWTCLCL